MRVYTYATEKPEGVNATKVDGYPAPYYLIPTSLSKAEKEKLLAEIATYCVCVSSEEEVDWDCDSSRSYSSDKDSYIDVPTSSVIIKEGAFWGYRTESVSWSGGATSEHKTRETVTVSLDSYSVTVDYYSVTTSDYDKTRTTSHTLVKRSEKKA